MSYAIEMDFDCLIVYDQYGLNAIKLSIYIYNTHVLIHIKSKNLLTVYAL